MSRNNSAFITINYQSNGKLIYIFKYINIEVPKILCVYAYINEGYFKILYLNIYCSQ